MTDRRVPPHDSTHMAPCERGCWFFVECGKESLACKQFENWVNYGVQLEPPKKMPTKEMYDRIFKNYAIGRPRNG